MGCYRFLRSGHEYPPLTQVTDALENTAQYDYTPVPSVSATFGLKGNDQRYLYNFRGQVTSLRSPLGEVTLNNYNARGNPVETTQPNGEKIHLQY